MDITTDHEDEISIPSVKKLVGVDITNDDEIGTTVVENVASLDGSAAVEKLPGVNVITCC